MAGLSDMSNLHVGNTRAEVLQNAPTPYQHVPPTPYRGFGTSWSTRTGSQIASPTQLVALPPESRVVDHDALD